MTNIHSHICAPAVNGQGAHSWMHDEDDYTFEDPKLCPKHMAELDAELAQFKKVSLTFLEDWPIAIDRFPLQVLSGEREVNIVDSKGKAIAREQVTWQGDYTRISRFLSKLVELLNYGYKRL
jgi:hypothetical protein